MKHAHHETDVYAQLLKTLYSTAGFLPKSDIPIDWVRLIPIMPSELHDKLYKYDVESAGAVVAALQQEQEYDNALAYFIDIICRDWPLFRPSTRLQFKEISNHHHISKISELKRLNDFEVRETTIAWGVADGIYFTQKKTVLAELKKLGFDLYDQRPPIGDPAEWKSKIIPLLADLLVSRREIDLSLIALTQNDLRGRLSNTVDFRVEIEYSSLIEELQDYSQRLASWNKYWPNWIDHYMAFGYEFVSQACRRKDETAQNGPSSEWMTKIKQVIGEYHMTRNYTFTGGNVVLAESGAVVSHVNQTLYAQPNKGELAELFGALKADVATSQTLTPNKRSQLTKLVEGAESEAIEAAPDKATISGYLNTFRNVMSSAGELYDTTIGWGSRLAQIAAVVGIGSS